MGPIQDYELDNRFNYHAPDETARRKHERARQAIKDVAAEFIRGLPPSRETSLAITKLEEAMFWTNAAIARHDENGARR